MTLRESLDQILQSETSFGELFYETFFSRCPEAAEYFRDVDMRRQALELTMALTLVEQYHAKGFSAIAQYLQQLGTRHSDLGIPRELHSDWRETLLATLAQFLGDGWSDTLQNEWRRAIDAGTKVMFLGYDHRVGM